jgi:hypothetical protein
MAAGPSVSLLLAAIGAVAVGALLPATPLARTLGFQPLPGSFCLALALMITCFLRFNLSRPSGLVAGVSGLCGHSG